MKKLIVITLLALVLVSAAGIVYAAAGVTCPVDGSGAFSTGATRNVNGHIMWEYKCELYGHVFWVAR